MRLSQTPLVRSTITYAVALGWPRSNCWIFTTCQPAACAGAGAKGGRRRPARPSETGSARLPPRSSEASTGDQPFAVSGGGAPDKVRGKPSMYGVGLPYRDRVGRTLRREKSTSGRETKPFVPMKEPHTKEHANHDHRDRSGVLRTGELRSPHGSTLSLEADGLLGGIPERVVVETDRGSYSAPGRTRAELRTLGTSGPQPAQNFTWPIAAHSGRTSHSSLGAPALRADSCGAP